MTEETKTVTLELTERQSNILFGAVNCVIDAATLGTLGELIQNADRFHLISQVAREELVEDPDTYSDDEDVHPQIVKIMQSIHDPFCTHDRQKH